MNIFLLAVSVPSSSQRICPRRGSFRISRNRSGIVLCLNRAIIFFQLRVEKPRFANKTVYIEYREMVVIKRKSSLVGFRTLVAVKASAPRFMDALSIFLFY